MENNDVVVPGEELAVIEEFSPLNGTYSDENGFVRASLLGKVSKDLLNKVIRVNPVKSRYAFPMVKDIVIGYVSFLRGEIAMVNIVRDGNLRPLTGQLAGFLHISQTGAEGRHISEHIAPGDLIRARVISSENPFQLSIKHPSLGVILASCSQCGAILRRDGDKLVCPKCGNIEKRKIASGYLNLKRIE
ncbi:MAG: exosome complex RNA-binding protein Csl4 [Fervidicoccaceae archaeon]